METNNPKNGNAQIGFKFVPLIPSDAKAEFDDTRTVQKLKKSF
jgi:hypothetical protein